MNTIMSLPPVTGPQTWVGIDIEIFTKKGDRDHLHRPHTGKFASLQIATDVETVYIITQEELVAEALQRINNSVWVFHNGKFDITHLRRWAEVPPRKKYFDTMYVDRILWNGYYSHFSLADLARRYLHIYMEKETRETFEGGTELTREQLEYAALDAINTLKIALEQRKILTKQHIKIWETIDRPVLWAFLDFKGFAINVPGWMALAEEHRAKQHEIDATLPMNPRSSQQVGAFLKSEKIKFKTTEADELQHILDSGKLNADAASVISDILLSRKYATWASRYGASMIEKYLEKDGDVDIIYGDYSINGAECLPAGELVLTNRGYIPVERVVCGDKVITHKGRTKEIVDTASMGVQDICIVTLDNGLSLRTTLNHPYLLQNGQWKQAGNLSVYDVVTIHSPSEVWKTIDGWDIYEVSSWGRVRNRNTGRCLAQLPGDVWGHLKVTLVRNGSKVRGNDRKDFRVHQLVAKAFIPNPEQYQEVRHLNGIAWDNTINNLCWGTRMDNVRDAMQHGTMSHRNGPQAKLTEDMVACIRNPEFMQGKTDQIVATQFGVSREIVRDVKLGKRWPDHYFDGKGKTVNFNYASVVSIEYDGSEVVYGLTVDEDESHVTGGIVTHNTARTSCARPNMQNIPARETKVFRKQFVSRPGHKLIIADYSSQEPCISAVVSGEPRLIEWIWAKKDIYVELGKIILGREITKDSEERKQMKPLILGGNYGLSKYGLAKKLGVSVDEAEDLMKKLRKALPVFAEYTDQQRKERTKVFTPFGREIWLDSYSSQAERNALNAPIQGGAGDQMKTALGNLHHKWNDHFFIDFPVVGYIHDELVADVQEEYVRDVEEYMKEIMEKTATDMVGGVVPFRVGTDVGDTWADKH